MDHYGFKIESRSLPAIEKILCDIKATVYEKAQKLYAELLSREIQILVDEISTNVYGNAHLERSIYNESVGLLNKKISIAMAKGFDTEYNFNVAVNVFSYNKDTYLQFVSPNRAFFDVVKDITGLHDVSIYSGIDSTENEKRQILWDAVVSDYNDHSCLVMKIFPLKPFDAVPYEKMHFDTPQQRAEVLAYRRLVNRFLSAYAGGGDIQPHKLMEFLEQAQTKASTPETKDELSLRMQASCSQSHHHQELFPDFGY